MPIVSVIGNLVYYFHPGTSKLRYTGVARNSGNGPALNVTVKINLLGFPEKAEPFLFKVKPLAAGWSDQVEIDLNWPTQYCERAIDLHRIGNEIRIDYENIFGAKSSTYQIDHGHGDEYIQVTFTRPTYIEQILPS